MSINTCNTPISVWLAEGQSSQRDMLLSLQALKAQQMPLHIIASHRHDRPEILGCADMAYREPHFLPQGLSVEALQSFSGFFLFFFEVLHIFSVLA